METPIATNSLVLGPLLARNARYRPLHTAVVVAPRTPDEREVRLTSREFDAYVNRLANALASLGVARGDRVATVLANSLELLATYWACAKLGAAAMPLSPMLTATGLASLLADAPPKVVLAASEQIPNNTEPSKAPQKIFLRIAARQQLFLGGLIFTFDNLAAQRRCAG